jgi:mono/diheme cytochrome c family protein
MRRVAVACVLLALLAGVTGLQWWRTHAIGPVQRGARAAAARGCLSCHGEGGRLADPEGVLGIGPVPSFAHDDVAAYARSEAEIREWIQDGKPRRLREEQAGEAEALVRMPAWRGILSARELDEIVVWLKAVSDFDPVPEAIVPGRDAAARLGCFACHGPGGRGDTPNPGSLKGYVPSWSGSDFGELARDDAEIREWIRDGSPRRLRENPAAAFFMRRQAIRMPAFGDRVSEPELRQITAYIRWLRGTSR